MPVLPSGLSLALDRGRIFDHGGNWFTCPDGHIWVWAASPEMGEPPYDPEGEQFLAAIHAPAPVDLADVARFVRVLEQRPDGLYRWRGEWLDTFPRFTPMTDADRVAWEAWLAGPGMRTFLAEAFETCLRLVDMCRRAQGYATFVDLVPTGEDHWHRGKLLGLNGDEERGKSEED